MNRPTPLSRRRFLQTIAPAGAAVFALPTLVPSTVFGANSRIQILQIGCGRIAYTMDLPGILKHDLARVIAVSDVDTRRMAQMKDYVEKHYANRSGAAGALTVKTAADYRQFLADPSIDAVSISTPDHWHAEPIVAAARAGKDVYVQKPLAMTVAEGRLVSDTLRDRKTAFQIGSQQRSDGPWPQFRRAVELVRNGRIGTLKTVKVGLPTDPAGKVEPEMPVPPNLDFDRWLGATPSAPYTENRVHPQNSLTDRPGWLRIESYCLGMITGWGSHHLDIAHWGMNTELTGPIKAVGRATFPKQGLWNVHGEYHIEMQYANGVTLIVDDKFPNGIRFEGSEGWVFVTRGQANLGPTPPTAQQEKVFAASDLKILHSPIGPNELHFHRSADHHLDWLQSIPSRRPAATTPEQAHRSTTACQVAWIAMKLGREITWDPVQESFPGDAEANALRSRPERAPYGVFSRS